MNSAGFARHVDNEHGQIVEAALAHDTDRAVALLVDQDRKTGDFLYRHLAEREQQPLEPTG